MIDKAIVYLSIHAMPLQNSTFCGYGGSHFYFQGQHPTTVVDLLKGHTYMYMNFGHQIELQ